MPAPATIRTRFDTPSLLATLGAEAGSASARRDSAQRSYQMQLQQMAQDSAFLRDEAQRRFDASSRGVPQISPTMLSDAAGYSARPQTFTNPAGGNPLAQYVTDRQASDASTGFMPTRTPSSAPSLRGTSLDLPRGGQDLVPAVGPTAPQAQGPSVQIVERDTDNQFIRFPEGTQISAAGDVPPAMIQQMRASSPQFNAPAMVTPQVRAQLDAIRPLEGTIPQAQFQALQNAAMSGQMDMSQLLDDARQMTPGASSSRLTAPQKQVEKAQANKQVINILDQGTPQDRAIFAEQERLFEPEEPDPFLDNTPEKRAAVARRNVERGERAYQVWRNLQSQLADAYSGPMPMTGGSDEVRGEAQGGYEVGQSYGGMKYLGGDPNDERSWSK